MRTKGSHGQWLNPWKVCPDAKESKVHHGRYWSNVACNNDFTRNKGKRSAKTKLPLPGLKSKMCVALKLLTIS